MVPPLVKQCSEDLELNNGTWPELKPCKRKGGRVPFDQMLRHIREDHCEQRTKVMLYFDREDELELYLRNSRNWQRLGLAFRQSFLAHLIGAFRHFIINLFDLQ